MSKSFNFHESFEVGRDRLPPPSRRLGFRKEIGEPEGQEADYRLAMPGGQALHVKVFTASYRIHRDKFDPHTFPILHLLFDAPEIVIMMVAMIAYAIFAAWDISKTDKKHKWLKAVLYSFLGIVIGIGGYVLLKMIREHMESENSGTPS